MTRHRLREIALHLIFSIDVTDESAEEFINNRISEDYFDSLAGESDVYSTLPTQKEQTYLKTLIPGVYEHLAELDGYIEKYASKWDFARISKIATSIMRLSMYEILYMEDIPSATAVNEAVEFAKQYDGPETASFINGVLGSFIKQEMPI